MNKKQKSSIILASLASIAVAGSLIAGSTYALFTSESKTNIAVTSGTVDVTATILDLKTYSGVNLTGDATTDTISETAEAGKFTNGGTATLSDNTLTLDKVTPGDKVTFTIKLENKSNVAIKYRTVITCEEDDGLLSGLEFTIGGTSFDGLKNKSVWKELSANETIEDNSLDCVVNLPSSAGNTYKEKTCKVSYTVEAVQGNAATTNPDENVIEIDNAAQLGLFRDSVNKEEYSKYIGKTVTLTNDIDLDGAEWTPIAWAKQSEFTFDGNEKTISNFKVNVGTDGTKPAGFFACASCITIKNLTIDNATIVGTNHVGAITGNGLCTKIENCHVTNSDVVSSTWLKPDGKYDDGDKAGAIVGYLSAEPGAHVSGSSATNCTVKGYRDIGGLVGFLNTNEGASKTTAYVTGNSVKNTTILNDRSNNYKSYTNNTEYDANEVVGEQAILKDKTAPLSLVDNNTCDNVSIKVINNNEYVSLSVTSNDATKGSVSLSGGTWKDGKVKIGDTITITVTPTSDAYKFNWLTYKVGGENVGDELEYSYSRSDGTCTIKVPNYDIALEAEFVAYA